MSYTDYPKAASNNAKRALKYKEESGNPRGCGTPVGWRRATTLANRSPISEDVVKRMASFNRHRQHKDVPYDEGCGGLMWDAWGGTAGVNWAIRKSKEIDEEKNIRRVLTSKNNNKNLIAMASKSWHEDDEKMTHDDDKMDHDEMKNTYYETVEEAQQHADMLGCSGTHTHEVNGETYYMACSTHNEYLQYEEQMKNNTMSYAWKTKNSSAEIKSVDMDRRVVEGYYSVFDFKDSDGDVIMKGAYEKTIRENGPGGKNRIMHLYQHDPLMVLGKPTALMEDEKGLYFKTIITDTNLGTDVLKLYRDGVLTEHSVGINFVQREYSSNDDSYIVKEVKMWEGSTVTWGANEMAIGSVKGSSKDKLDQYNRLHKAYYDGTYTDETFLLIEKQLKYLEQVIRKSLQNEKPTQVTLKDEAGSIANMFKQFNNQLQIEKEFKKWT